MTEGGLSEKRRASPLSPALLLPTHSRVDNFERFQRQRRLFDEHLFYHDSDANAKWKEQQIRLENTDHIDQKALEDVVFWQSENNARSKQLCPPLELQSEEKKLRAALERERKSLKAVPPPAADVSAGDTAGRGARKKAAVSVAATRVDLTELVLPQNANHMGNTFGGQVILSFFAPEKPAF